MNEFTVECLLQVAGDTAALNTFDKQFRSGAGPQWADRPNEGTPRYSLHALYPVPDDVQRRGYETAGLMWCQEYWGIPDDLAHMQVKRVLGKRRYRFYTMLSAPQNVFWKASADFPTLRLRLFLVGADKGDFQAHTYHEGMYQGSFMPHRAEDFFALREDMGFAA